MKNKLLSTSVFTGFAAIIATMIIGGMSTPARAIAFFDDFDDGKINTSVYSALGNSSLTESNGNMSLNLTTVGDGVSVLFPEEINCMIFDFEPLGFVPTQGITFTVLEDNLRSLEFSIFETNSLKAVIQGFDENGKPRGKPITVEVDKIGINGKEVSVNGKKRLRLDWITKDDGSMAWNVDFRDENIPDPLVEEVLALTTIFSHGKRKVVDITFNGSKDPLLSFQQIRGEKIHPVPEPSSTLSLLALGTLGAASTLKRKEKSSKLTEKKTIKVG